MLEGTGARDEIWHGDTVARGHGKLVGTGARDEIWHGDTVARGHGKLEDTGTRDEIWHGDTGARMARRARDLSDSFSLDVIENKRHEKISSTLEGILNSNRTFLSANTFRSQSVSTSIAFIEN